MINALLIGLCSGLGFYIGIFIYENHIRYWFKHDEENIKSNLSQESV